jgi:hypothetical protein
MRTAVVHFGGITYRQVYRHCRKKTCTKCPHGPYWYGYQWRDGKTQSFYCRGGLPFFVASESTVREELRLQGFRLQGSMVVEVTDGSGAVDGNARQESRQSGVKGNRGDIVICPAFGLPKLTKRKPACQKKRKNPGKKADGRS